MLVFTDNFKGGGIMHNSYIIYHVHVVILKTTPVKPFRGNKQLCRDENNISISIFLNAMEGNLQANNEEM